MSCVTVNRGQDALVKEIFNLDVLFPGKIKGIIILKALLLQILSRIGSDCLRTTPHKD